MKKCTYAIFDSPANRTILSYLGIAFEARGGRIYFEWEPSRENFMRLVEALRTLGYAHSDEYAAKVATSFFLNRVA